MPIFVFLFIALFTVGHLRDAFCAEEFPRKEIRLVTPYGVGGSVDIVARIYADHIGKTLAVPIVVVNNTAGGGSVAPLSVAKAKPDGYNLLYAAAGLLSTKVILNPEIPYRHTDFTPVSLLIENISVLWVQNDAPWKDLKELVDYAKENPGKLRGTGGVPGSGIHVLMDLFQGEAGIKFVNIPTTGGAAMTTAVMGGHAEFCFDVITAGIDSMRAGRLRALASTRKVPGFPMIKTFEEQGHPLPWDLWHGVFAPKGLPKPILSKLTKAFEIACNDASLQEQLMKLYIFPHYRDPEETTKFVDNEWEMMLKILKQSGMAK